LTYAYLDPKASEFGEITQLICTGFSSVLTSVIASNFNTVCRTVSVGFVWRCDLRSKN